VFLLLLSPLLPLLPNLPNAPDVAFLPGIIGSWNEFLLPFFVYGLFGTAVWFMMGWLLVRVTGSRSFP
jgi:hypothetical protein